MWTRLVDGTVVRLRQFLFRMKGAKKKTQIDIDRCPTASKVLIGRKRLELGTRHKREIRLRTRVPGKKIMERAQEVLKL